MPADPLEALRADAVETTTVMERVFARVPDIKDHPRRDHPDQLDIAKFNGEVRCFDGRKWIRWTI